MYIYLWTTLYSLFHLKLEVCYTCALVEIQSGPKVDIHCVVVIICIVRRNEGLIISFLRRRIAFSRIVHIWYLRMKGAQRREHYNIYSCYYLIRLVDFNNKCEHPFSPLLIQSSHLLIIFEKTRGNLKTTISANWTVFTGSKSPRDMTHSSAFRKIAL